MAAVPSARMASMVRIERVIIVTSDKCRSDQVPAPRRPI